jgi:hypothetical protein
LTQLPPDPKDGVPKNPLIMISRNDYRRFSRQQTKLVSKVPVLLSMASLRLIEEVASDYDPIPSCKVSPQSGLHVNLCIRRSAGTQVKIAQVQQAASGYALRTLCGCRHQFRYTILIRAIISHNVSKLNKTLVSLVNWQESSLTRPKHENGSRPSAAVPQCLRRSRRGI